MAEVGSDRISVRILFFAQAREQTKLREANLELLNKPATYTARTLLSSIVESFPRLKPIEKCLILAQNQKYLDCQSEEYIHINANDELAVIPPISSG